MLSIFQYLLLITHIIIIIDSTKIIINQYSGSIFNGNYSNKYFNSILNCDNNNDCYINCESDNSCFNGTVNCPINQDTKCEISCIGSNACMFLDINWYQTANNSLYCANGACTVTPYPPPIDDNISYTYLCDEANECKGLILTCPDNAKCNIICSAQTSCYGNRIYCPSTAPCNIQCTAQNSCQYSIVFWSTNQHLANVTCTDSANCNRIQLPSIMNATNYTNNSIPYTFKCLTAKACNSAVLNCPKDTDCIVECSGASGIATCVGITINCPINGNCHITCNPMSSSCWEAIINGPINNTLSVYCQGGASCQYASIYAQHTSYFNLTIALPINGDVSNSNTAGSVSIWFPPRDDINDIERAYISANQRFHGNYGYEPQQFYAINGWKDVHIEYTGDYTKHGGIMYCNYDYSDSCWFANNSWSCNPENTICDDPVITSYPTIQPTNHPSDIPSSQPTTIPSILPTTDPTSIPTIDPTLDPSTTPSVMPTTMPSVIIYANKCTVKIRIR